VVLRAARSSACGFPGETERHTKNAGERRSGTGTDKVSCVIFQLLAMYNH
jgi:hypothetical protein